MELFEARRNGEFVGTSTMTMRAIISGLVGMALVSSCRPSEPSDGSRHTVLDSAGIEIVTNHARAWRDGEGWRVSDRPALTIGELDGPPELTFGRVAFMGVGWLSDGRIFVGDEEAHTIRVFSSEGDYLQSAGREGRGPGELQWFQIVSPYRGDSLWVHDYAQEIVTVFSPALTYARGFRNPVPEGNYWVTGSLADGRFLLTSPGSGRPGRGPGIVADTSGILLSAPDGSSVDTIGAYVSGMTRYGVDGRSYPVHFSPNGRAMVAGDRIIVTEGKEFEYSELELDGTVRRIVRKEHEPAPVTNELIEEYKAHALDAVSADPGASPELVRRSLDEAEYASRLPALHPDPKVDPLGHLWIRRYHFPRVDAREWEVFDSDGVWLGTVETPPGLEVHEIGVDHIIGVAKGEYDVPYVQVHRLSRR